MEPRKVRFRWHTRPLAPSHPATTAGLCQRPAEFRFDEPQKQKIGPLMANWCSAGTVSRRRVRARKARDRLRWYLETAVAWRATERRSMWSWNDSLSRARRCMVILLPWLSRS